MLEDLVKVRTQVIPAQEEGIKHQIKPNLTSIIILARIIQYPLLHYTGNCVGRIREHTDKEKDPYEIILVDNGSTIKDRGKPFHFKVDKVIANKENIGVAKSWNQGIRVSQGGYICLMNNDIQVYDHWLSDLKECLTTVDVIMATPMYDDCHARALEANLRRQRWIDKPLEESLNDFRDYSCFLTTRKVFDEVGLFDENFQVGYSEDIDWTFRALQKGYQVKSTKRVNIHHVVGATAYYMPEIGKQMNENKEYLRKKWEINQWGVPKFIRERQTK